MVSAIKTSCHEEKNEDAKEILNRKKYIERTLINWDGKDDWLKKCSSVKFGFL